MAEAVREAVRPRVYMASIAIGGYPMPIYEITADRIVPLAVTSFAAAGLRERQDLQ